MAYGGVDVDAVLSSLREQFPNARANTARMAELTERGEAEDGKIVAVAGPTGTLRSVELDTRAMRLPSADLAAGVVTAAALAADDTAVQLRTSGARPALAGWTSATSCTGRPM